MQNRLVISRDDLAHNVRALTAQLDVPIIAVVKMNGYGITIRHAVDAWYAGGLRFFAVAEPAEAFTAAGLGYEDIDILLMSPVYDPALLDRLVRAGVILTVCSEAGARAAAEAGARAGMTPRAHVKVDTGFGRFGPDADDKDAVAAIYGVRGLSFEGIFSHFAASFEPKFDLTGWQLAKFQALLAALDARGIACGMAHIANSCAAIRFPQTRLDAVRVGSALLGRQANPAGIELKKVGVLEADIADMRVLKPGDTTGYAMLYRAKRPVTAAVAALGHQTGFGLDYHDYSARLIDVLRNLRRDLRAYKQPLTVTHAATGARLPVIGRVGHQYTLLDAAGVAVGTGDTVTAPVNILLVDAAIPRVLR